MKPLIPVLVVATTSLAVASVQFARQASTERERADTEMALRQKAEARVVQLERAQQLAPISADPAPSDDAPAPATASTQPATSGNRPAFGARELGLASIEERGAPPREMLPRPPRMMDSPAARNFMRTRVKSNLRRMYEDAGTALGISAEKTGQLVDLLAEQQTRNLGRPPQPTDGQTMQQFFAEQQKKNQDEIAALIGQDKLDEWQAYQKTLPERLQLSQVREQLEGAGVPMNESQRTELLAAIQEEVERNPRPSFNNGLAPEEAAAQMNQWQADYDKAIMDRAKDLLSADQFKAYKEYQDWQTEMRNSFVNRAGRIRNGGPTGNMAADVSVSLPFIAVTPGPPPETK